MDDELQDAIDDIGIRRLQSAYADVVTRRAWAELTELFLPDARVSIDRRAGEPLLLTGPGEVGSFIRAAIARFSFFQFVVLNGRILLRHEGDPDRATARLYMSELRQDAESGRWSTVYGLYQDRYARRDGGWWIAGRRYHSLARTAAVDFDVFPFPDLES